jgi:hypothetical protein
VVAIWFGKALPVGSRKLELSYLLQLVTKTGGVPMASNGNGPIQPYTDPGAYEMAWRHFWLTNVLLDSGKPPARLARREMPTRKDSLTRRLHRLRRMRATLDVR